MPGFVLESPRCLETCRPVNRPRDTSAKPGGICYTLQLRTAVPACGAFDLLLQYNRSWSLGRPTTPIIHRRVSHVAAYLRLLST